jgi:hypothetical protein
VTTGGGGRDEPLQESDAMESTARDVPPVYEAAGPGEVPPARGRIRLPVVAAGGGAGGAWKKAVREFAVIVAGVMAAQGAQAWWDARQDRDREHDYLRQLLADTRTNESRLADAIRADSVTGLANSRAIDALTSTQAPPPADSVVRWVKRTGSMSYFMPLSGTFRALLGTGDLRLVRNDSLRARIAAYATLLENEDARQGDLRANMIHNAAPFARAFPFIRRVFLHDDAKPMADVQRLRADPDAAAVLFSMQAGNANRLAGLRMMRDATVEMRRALEAEPYLRDAK